MNAFEVVTFVVAVAAVILAAYSYFRLNRALSQLGRRGSNWFDRAEDLPIEDRPSEDDMDAPIPKRPLRGRPE
ncbi:MAG: hypothetical protein QOD66_1839 [Solirubrobacteraceae bacterium]|jgi:hypothetical protein|nr:hypothetical protein [Solirubrobacteraceae bacterium]